MSQQLTSFRLPFLPMRLEVHQQIYEEEARLDTGFDGGIAMPPSYLAGLEPEWDQRWTLADGSQVPASVYRGIVRLGAFEPIPVLVVAIGEEYIIGLGILNRFAVTFDHGEQVILSA